MQQLNQPSQEHPRFDALCSGVQEWETLPEPDAPTGIQMTADEDGEENGSALDSQILAGLVSPC